MAITAVTLTSCGEGLYRPYKEPIRITVGSNEDGFLIDLRGGSKMGKLTLDDLRKTQVRMKTIVLEQEWVQTGRAIILSAGKWVPTQALIRVNKTPVSCEWVDGSNGTRSTTDDGHSVESSDSIEFTIGSVMQCRVKDSALFRHSYADKTLLMIANQDIKALITNILTKEFGKLNVEDCKTNKAKVWETVEKVVKHHFLTYGIEITHLGQSGGMTFTNKAIQTAIDSKATADAQIKVAQKEQERRIIVAQTRQKEELITQNKLTLLAKEQQKRETVQFETKKLNALIQKQQEVELSELEYKKQAIINKRDTEIADAGRYIKEQEAKVLPTTIALKKLAIQQTFADAQLARGRNYKGGVPHIMFGGGQTQGDGMLKFLNVNDLIDKK